MTSQIMKTYNPLRKNIASSPKAMRGLKLENVSDATTIEMGWTKPRKTSRPFDMAESIARTGVLHPDQMSDFEGLRMFIESQEPRDYQEICWNPYTDDYMVIRPPLDRVRAAMSWGF